jgi:hypothetical protein
MQPMEPIVPDDKETIIAGLKNDGRRECRLAKDLFGLEEMPDIFIVATPAIDSMGKRKHDRFDAYLRNTGERICSATRQPLPSRHRMTRLKPDPEAQKT